jgi:hypothetical protein
MGRGRRARTRRNRRKRSATAQRRASRLEVSIDQLEAARAHDGPFRGRVEPRLVVGAYHVRSGRAVLVGRSLTSIEVEEPAPFRIRVEKMLACGIVDVSDDAARPGVFVILALAFEEDSGKDIQRFYAALELPGEWQVWDSTRAVPEPRTLDDLGRLQPNEPPEPEQVQLLFGPTHTPASSKSDELIGALMIRVRDSSRARRAEYRFHFRAPDGRNDWTAVLRVRVTGN